MNASAPQIQTSFIDEHEMLLDTISHELFGKLKAQILDSSYIPIIGRLLNFFS